MLEYLHISNFQSHRNTLIKFVKGVNVLFGISLSGKTAIARAINLVVNNRPLGCKFFSNFSPDKGKTIIELKATDAQPIAIDKTVRRKSDKSKILEDTTYKLGKEEFSGMEKGVPDQIKKAINLTEMNVQKQFDQPFLILSSAGEVARTINRVTKLDKVDDWVRDLDSKIRKTKTEVKLLESQAKTDEIELAKYAGFEDLENEVQELQNTDKLLEAARQQYSTLDSLLTKAEAIEEELERLSPALSIEEDIKQIEALETSIALLTRKAALVGKAKSADAAIKGLTGLKSDLMTLQVFMEQEDEAKRLGAFLYRVEQIEKSIESLELEYNRSKSEYLKLLKGVKVCPIFSLPCPVVKEMSGKVEKGL